MAIGVPAVRAWRRWHGLRARTRVEDALKHLFDQEYRDRHASFASLEGALRLDDRPVMRLVATMQPRTPDPDGPEGGPVRSRGGAWRTSSRSPRTI